MPFDLRIEKDRKTLIKEVLNTDENTQRKADSAKQQEIMNDRLDQYVREHLKGEFGADTVKEMPIISSVNLTRRIVKQEASIYRDHPERDFLELSPDQIETVGRIYDDMKIDSMLAKSNENFKLQQQTHLQIVPRNGKLIMRTLMGHHIDSIPDPLNPEEAIGYVISSFDKESFLRDNTKDTPTGFKGRSVHTAPQFSDGVNQKIGDRDDAKSTLKRYVVWTRDHHNEKGELIPGMNFIMNGKAEILSDVNAVLNPLRDIDPTLLPIINVANNEGTFEYWVRQGQSVSDFNIAYAAELSSLSQIVRLQGYSQAVLSGSKELMHESLQIGPTKFLKLTVDPDQPVDTKFEFVNPSPDLDGSIRFLEMLLANFLTSRGVDPKIISGKSDATSFSSGIERLLHNLERFEASREDISLFTNAEDKIFNLVKAWHNVSRGTDRLEEKYLTSVIPDESSVVVSFNKPEMIQTRQERIAQVEKEMDLGLISRIDALEQFHGIDRDAAIEKAKQIDEDEGMTQGEEDGEEDRGSEGLDL